MTQGDGRREVSVDTVRALLRAQFPRWAEEPVEQIRPGGWDNRSFRLGPDKLVRMPSAERYAGQPVTEAAFLPRLAPHLPVPVPEVLGLGVPGEGYPFHWTVLGWHEGTTAEHPGSVGLARDLAGVLRALWTADVGGVPTAGPGNFQRGGDLAVYDAEARAAFARLAEGPALTRLWDRARVSRWTQPPVVVHGDVAAGNLILRGGRLAAVIDFGCLGAGDPACDLQVAWTLFDGEARAAFAEGVSVDRETWARARGWAAWKAAITLRGHAGSGGAARVLDQLLSEASEETDAT